MTSDVGAPETQAAGWLGAPPCRDLAIGVTGMFLLRAVAAQVDPLATALERRLNLVLAALLLLVLVAAAAYGSTGRGRKRPLVAPERVPAWARPGAALTFVLAGFAALMGLLVVAGLFDESQSLVDHVSTVGTAVYVGLALRVQWAAATGRMWTLVPVVAPSRSLRGGVTIAAAAIGLAVVATAVAAPFSVRRDRERAACRRNELVSLDVQRAIGSLRGEALQQRIDDLASQLSRCASQERPGT